MKQHHPAADCCPSMNNEELAALAEDIKTNGLIHPIVLHDDLVLDGRDRQRACDLAGVEPRYTTLETDDPVAYVASTVQRKHFSTRQRAAIAADLANLKVGDVQSQHGASNDAPPVSNQQAADLMNVSPSSVQRAKKVKKENPVAHEAAKRGEKVKRKKKETTPWAPVAERHGLIDINTGGQNRNLTLNAIKEADPSIRFTRGAIDKQDEAKLEAACEALAIQRNPEKAQQDAEAEVAAQDLAGSPKEKLDAAIRAHKKKLNAEYEIRIQNRVRAELETILPIMKEDNERARKTVAAYKGIMTKPEYRMLRQALHTDGYSGLDGVQQARLEKAFNLISAKREQLCGFDELSVSTSIPSSVEELLKRKK